VVNKFVETDNERILTDSGIGHSEELDHRERGDSLDFNQLKSEVVLGNRSALEAQSDGSEKETSQSSESSNDDSDESDSDSSKSNEEVNKESDEDSSSGDRPNEESVKNNESRTNSEESVGNNESNPNVSLESPSSTNGRENLNGTINDESSIEAESEEQILNGSAKPAEAKGDSNNELIEETNHSDDDDQKKQVKDSSENLSQLTADASIPPNNSKQGSTTLVSTESVGGL